MKNHYLNSSVITVIAVLFILFIAAGCSVLLEKQYQNKESPDAVRIAPQTYLSQEECEQATGKSCGIAMCDVIPEGKTFEEVCGRGFRSGWQPMEENADVDTSIWQTYSNEQYGFEVKYASEWEVKSSKGKVTFVISKRPTALAVANITIGENRGLTLNQLTNDKVLQLAEYESDANVSKGNLGGLEAVKVEGSAKPYPGARVLDYYAVRDKYFYIVGLIVRPRDKWDDYNPTFNQILSTFKFIEPALSTGQSEVTYALLSRLLSLCLWTEQSTPYANLYVAYVKNGLVKYVRTTTTCADFPNTDASREVVGEKITLFPDAINPTSLQRENGTQYMVVSVFDIPSTWFLGRHLYYDTNDLARTDINHRSEFYTACNAILDSVEKDNCLFFYNQL